MGEPPHRLRHRLINNISAGHSEVLLIFPEWPTASWWTPTIARVKGPVIRMTGQVFQSPDGQVLPRQRWGTLAAVVQPRPLGRNPNILTMTSTKA